MKEKLQKWFRQGLWTRAMVENAAAKGLLTPEEGRQILETE